ncbi:MAG: hypothetical protein RI897_4175 [Verrucomicrobiota bacterium]
MPLSMGMGRGGPGGGTLGPDKGGDLLANGFGNGFDEGFAAEIFTDDIAFAIDEVGRGDGIDAVFLGKLIFPAFAVEELGPGHFALFDEGGQFVFILVEADADDFEAFVVVLFVGFEDVGEFGDAGSAPGCPEVDEDRFTFEFGEGEGLVIEVFDIEIGERFTDAEFCLDFGGFDHAGGVFGLWGVGEVGGELLEEGEAFFLFGEDLGIERGLHEEDLGDLGCFGVFMFGEQGIELFKFIGEGGFRALVVLEFLVNFSDELIELGFGVPGCVGGLGRESEE